MTEERKTKTAAKRAPATKKTAAASKSATAKSSKSAAKTKPETTKSKPKAATSKPKAVKSTTRKTATKTAAKAKKPAAKTAAKTTKRKTKAPQVAEPVEELVLEAIEDESEDAAAAEVAPEIELEPEEPADAEMEAFRAETEEEAEDAIPESAPAETEPEEEIPAEEGEEAQLPPAKLERLQKILSQAGIASRRRAEEMITEGRVIVNGQVVTQLGTKADPARDHIRVDGKLLHGAERRRYFMLNKPKGFVTTVSDPEGRPTVMQFFSKRPERLYPVGRLDFQSEGLLLMTNDGELANLLTKAGSGVEKTYLVKVDGEPSEEELDRLRGGVEIARGEDESDRVRTAPAAIRKIREGDNPWYEVVLIEGRNRELRKMFASIGHFAEKIRRVGYGPLVLDVEPGKFRELAIEEVDALQRTAEGKLKPRRVKVDLMLHKEAGLPAEQQKQFAKHRDKPSTRGGRPPRRDDWQPRERRSGEGEERSSFRRDEGRSFDKRPGTSFGAKPRFGRPPFKPAGERKFGEGEERGSFRRDEGRGGFGKRPGASFGAKPRFGRPPFKPAGERREGGAPGFGEGERRSFRPSGERPAFKRPEGAGQRFDRPAGGGFAKGPAKSWGDRPNRGSGQERRGQWSGQRSASSFRGSSDRPGSRPSSRPGSRPGGFSRFRKEGPGGGARRGPGFGGKRFGGPKRHD